MYNGTCEVYIMFDFAVCRNSVVVLSRKEVKIGIDKKYNWINERCSLLKPTG